MSNYSYEAVDAGGLKVEGKLEVVDQNEAIRRVKEMGLFPVRIVAGASGRRTSFMKRASRGAKVEGRGVAAKTNIEINIPYFSGRVKTSVLAIFTRQLATLIEAGMPLLRGLRLLREQEEDSAALRKIWMKFQTRLRAAGRCRNRWRRIRGFLIRFMSTWSRRVS